MSYRRLRSRRVRHRGRGQGRLPAVGFRQGPRSGTAQALLRERPRIGAAGQFLSTAAKTTAAIPVTGQPEGGRVVRQKPSNRKPRSVRSVRRPQSIPRLPAWITRVVPDNVPGRPVGPVPTACRRSGCRRGTVGARAAHACKKACPSHGGKVFPSLPRRRSLE